MDSEKYPVPVCMCGANLEQFNRIHESLDSLEVSHDNLHLKVDNVSASTKTMHGKLSNIQSYAHNLNRLPVIAQAMRFQAIVNAFLAATMAVFVIVILVRGSSLKITIPGWLEITGDQADVKFSEKDTP